MKELIAYCNQKLYKHNKIFIIIKQFYINLLIQNNDYAEALPYVEDIRSCDSIIYGENHPKYANMLYYLVILL